MLLRRLVLLVATPFVLLGCATSSTTDEPFVDPVVFKPASVLIRTATFPETAAEVKVMLLDSLVAMEGDGSYSEQVLEPNGGPHSIDCSVTETLSIMFIAGRPKSARSMSRFKLRSEWPT
ncbi:MAG: hypothetical protein AAGA33_05430 [Pseudomonadota bacterium]